MRKVDVMALLGSIDDYILLKKDEAFPDYATGSDLDLVVFDRERAIKAICEYFASHLADISEMRVSDTDEYCHIDFIFDGKLDLRIDLIDNFDFFQKFNVKPSFMVKLFKDRKSITSSNGNVFVPNDEDELTLRYFEYLEWFDRRPDKIKHIDYICAQKDTALMQRFFDNTHRYIQFKPKTSHTEKGPPRSGREALTLIKSGIGYFVFTALRRIGVKE